MKNYYYIDEKGQQAGPVSEDNLKDLNVTGKTLVWCEGMTDWTKVADVPELSYLCAAPVPPVPPVPPTPPTPPAPAEPAEPVAPVEPVVTPVNPVVQPQVNKSAETLPDNYLAWAIVSLALCWPFGIPAIINSTNVNKLWNSGDKVGAVEASESAHKWCKVATGVFIGLCGLCFLLGILSGI